MTTPTLAAARMGRRLTTPFGRGADTLALRLSFGGAVTPYDFSEHDARYGRAPEPAYVLTTVKDVGTATVIDADYLLPNGQPASARVTVPAGTPAESSVVLDIPVSAQLRVTGLTVTPPPPSVAEAWRLTALLGTTAKVLWVLGGERDQLRARLTRTAAQRHLPTATGPSLDLIGSDLGVPRFPPLPHGFDPGVVALYHLDDVPTGGTLVANDVTGQYPGRTGHPGTVQGSVLPGAAGRYGTGFAFNSDDAVVAVATHPAFDIAADASATMECFVRPDPAGGAGNVLSRRAGVAAGWSLSIGEFDRGVVNNARLEVAAATTTITLFADLSLPTDRFTHLAAVLDRAANVLLLHVDGVVRAGAPLGALGAVATTAPLRIGPGGSGFRGVVDEVRISSVARQNFAPALGEADEHYRRRLRMFRRWALPTPANLTAMLNELVGTIGGLADPLVVEDTNATLVRGTRLVRVRPVTLARGESIDAAGRHGVSEVDTVGTAAREDRFDPRFLVRYQDTAHLVHIGVAECLDRLADLVAGPGELVIGGSHDPAAPDLRATGRAVLVGHSSIDPGRLAALAHLAGFDFVRLRVNGDSPVYAAVAPGDYFRIDVASSSELADVDLQSTATLTLRPEPPPGAAVRWLTVPDGNGRGTVVGNELLATAPGRLVVQAEVRLNRRTVSASRAIRVGPGALPDGAAIAADGTLNAPVSVVSEPREFFDERFLVRHNDSRVNYGNDENRRLMQPAVAQLLNALLDAAAGHTGQLVITSAFQPDGDEFAAHGRELELSHPSVQPGVLAELAHAVGFGHVSRSGSTVVVRQAPGELVIAGPDGGLVVDVDEGATVDFPVRPELPEDQARFGWATGGFGTAEAALGSPRRAPTTVRGVSAGLAWVQASYLLGDLPAPHTFRVGLRPELDNPATVISKDQYDLILNILTSSHPIGVEVDTRVIREHTVEVRGDLAAINPEFTYPKFRVRRLLPPQRRDTTRG